ncbi:MAG: efflux RND transporter periplasmic adaptor subunit [Candidatus Desantisbacteria bacterium]
MKSATFSIIDPANIWIQANIKETDIGRLKLNQQVEIHADQYPGVKFLGRVRDIGIATNSTFALLPSSNSNGNFVKVVQNIPVKIKLDSINKSLAIGSSVTIKINTRRSA